MARPLPRSAESPTRRSRPSGPRAAAARAGSRRRRAPRVDPDSTKIPLVRPGSREDRQRDDDDVGERDRDHPLPPERHELVEPVARERRAEPDVGEEEASRPSAGTRRRRHDVEERESLDAREGPQPAAEEHRRSRRTRSMIMVVYSPRKKNGELHAGVLGVEARRRARSRPPEGRRGCGSSPRRPPRSRGRTRRGPGRRTTGGCARCALDDLDERERARHEEHATRARGPSAPRSDTSCAAERRPPEERVLVVRGPAAEDDPVDPDRRDREQEEKPDVHVRHVERRRDGARSQHGTRARTG